MAFQKPLVTIELDEYLKTQEYIKTLENVNRNKYQQALGDIIHHCLREPPSGIKIGEILMKYEIKLVNHLGEKISVE